MDLNYSIWDTYGSNFIDPLFIPYQNDKITNNISKGCPVNKTKTIGGMNTLVHPELIRKNWGLSFMKKHTNYPCPIGWMKMNKDDDNWCVQVKPEYTPLFYTNLANIPKNMYFEGYTNNIYNNLNGADKYSTKYGDKFPNEFEYRSQSPYKDEYVSSYKSKNSCTNYKKLPSKNSYFN